MSGITTHVLDTARGRPAAGMRVGRGPDGRRLDRRRRRGHRRRRPGAGLVAPGTIRAGVHRLTFATGEWFEAEGVVGLPAGHGRRRIEDPDVHHHVPLLLSPYGYSTYRGS